MNECEIEGFMCLFTGGQFLRAYVERYSHAVAPVRNLITFGSQHMGISDLPVCSPTDILCQVSRRLAKQAVYGKWAQENLVQVRENRIATTFMSTRIP
jgi:palmitoyl-protein thioesterase